MRHWIAGTLVAGLAVALVPFAQRRASADQALSHGASARASATPSASPATVPAKPAGPPPLAGVDLSKIQWKDGAAFAPAAANRIAHLTLDVGLEEKALRILRSYKVPEAGVVVMEVATGRILVYASYQQKHGAEPRDLCVEAIAPAASVFKIVTGAALVEDAGMSPDVKQCYSGGEQRLTPLDLVDNPARDRWCATLSEAMGRSINAVFARLALKNLKPPLLTSMAGAFGFGDPVPFDVPVAASAVNVPEDPLGFARTAAGFWNTTLTPIEAASIAGTVANEGETVRPVIVDSVEEGTTTIYQAPGRRVIRRAIHAETASALTSMMESTVSMGTSYRAFHDPEGRAFLPNIAVAGKTGTLSRPQAEQYYTWFTGFAPSRSPEIAVAVLVINTPKWTVKANVVARNLLRAYFAAKGSSGVTAP